MEHARSKHLSDTRLFFHAIAAAAVAGLVMLGIGGTIYNLVAPGKWLAQIFDRSPASGIAAILALFIVGLCAWLTRNLLPAGDRTRYAECFAYGFALAGALYMYAGFSPMVGSGPA